MLLEELDPPFHVEIGEELSVHSGPYTDIVRTSVRWSFHSRYMTEDEARSVAIEMAINERHVRIRQVREVHG